MKVSDSEFTNDTVNLDGNEFIDCTFNNCQMIFAGVGSVNLTNCNIIEPKWNFVGPAGTTLTFLKTLIEGLNSTENATRFLVSIFPVIAEYVVFDEDFKNDE